MTYRWLKGKIFGNNPIYWRSAVNNPYYRLFMNNPTFQLFLLVAPLEKSDRLMQVFMKLLQVLFSFPFISSSCSSILFLNPSFLHSYSSSSPTFFILVLLLLHLPCSPIFFIFLISENMNTNTNIKPAKYIGLLLGLKMMGWNLKMEEEFEDDGLKIDFYGDRWNKENRRNKIHMKTRISRSLFSRGATSKNSEKVGLFLNNR